MDGWMDVWNLTWIKGKGKGKGGFKDFVGILFCSLVLFCMMRWIFFRFLGMRWD